MNILIQKNKKLYALPKVSLTSIEDYELLDYILSFVGCSFYFNIDESENDLDLIFVDKNEGFGFIGINNFNEVDKLIKVETNYLYIFKDFKVINKFSISENEKPSSEEWYFDVVLWFKCLKTGREKYVLVELR